MTSALLVSVMLAQTPPALELSALPPPAELVARVWRSSPELADAHVRLGLARADVQRSQLLLNPSLDLAVGGVPVGETNPVGLPAGQVVNGAVTVSQTVELGKRGPRGDAAVAALAQARWQAREAVRQKFFELEGHLAEVASAEVRIASLAESVQDAARLTSLQEARAGKGDTAGLDTDRAMLEQQKVEMALGDAREQLEQALRACSVAAGMECRPFGEPARAQAFLERIAPGEAAPAAESRPDVLALEAQASSANAQAVLAARRALPDPTFRVGYLRDQFVISGNNPSTAFVGVSVPLALFDHGQADEQSARVTATQATRLKALTLAQAQRDRARLEALLALARQRHERLAKDTLPLARKVVTNLQQALLVGTPLQDLLLARRSLQELTLLDAELDLLVFRTCLELDRVLGRQPPFPPELNESP